MPGGHLVPVLVLLHLFVLDEMGNINQHAAGINLAATDVLIEGVKDFVYLDGEGAGLGLAFTMACGFFSQLAQVFATHGGG